jgi:hypothetical protein
MLASALSDDIRLLGRPNLDHPAYVRVRIRLTVTDIKYCLGGMQLNDHEEFVIWIGKSPLMQPLIEVEHNRFLGYPHVLHGHQLCIYLDPSREWNPRQGVSSCLDRLYDWLTDAAANRFDPVTSLFHPIGGVPYGSSELPMVVVRDDPRATTVQAGYLIRRTDSRLDLYFGRTSSDQIQVPVFRLAMALPLGVGNTFADLIKHLDDGSNSARSRHPPQSPGFLTALAASASRTPTGTALTFVLLVPHPSGGSPFLLAGRVPESVADAIRRAPRGHQGPAFASREILYNSENSVEWFPVSDERDSVSTRRDSTSPISAFFGKTVQLWGCGGLGSWVAEFLVRAGVSRIILCDPGSITGGLLVRQNFTESDIGASKVAALRDRIIKISDNIEVEAHAGALPVDLERSMVDADVIIDATVSRAVGQFLDGLTSVGTLPLLGQIATDVKTGTLGILTISPQGEGRCITEIDQRVGEKVLADGKFESFHVFWSDVSSEDELTPTRGCSVPTFHGSAADMAAVAATLVSLLGCHLEIEGSTPGSHLIALPHSPNGPSHTFIQFD